MQGADYEGCVVDALEYVWTSGGDVLDGDRSIIDGREAARGLETDRSVVADGRIAPEGVSRYEGQEPATIFLGGDAVFMRNVPRMYALASDPAESEVEEPAVIGVAPLPVVEQGPRSYGVLGGWNLFPKARVPDRHRHLEFYVDPARDILLNKSTRA